MTVSTDSGGMVVDIQQPLPPIPQVQEQEKTQSGPFMPRVADTSFKPKRYRRGGPQVVKANLWGENGFYMNGPSVDPFNTAASNARQVEAYTSTWADTSKFAAVNRYVNLLNKYGHTNSPGVLWSMAVADIPDKTSIAQGLLKADAKETARTNIDSFPVTGRSPQANNQDNDPTDGFWQPAQFAARNLFSAALMPQEALFGAMRGIGGELTDETAPWLGLEEGRISGALAQLGSLVVPPISLWADRVRGDNDFTNPWEQTDFGQTLLSMASGKGWEAFTSQQAGLDIAKAKDELRLDPVYAAMELDEGNLDGIAEFNAAAVDLAKEKGYYGAPGWFIDETSPIGEAQRRATFDAWAIPGPEGALTSWTIGRGIASNIAGPNWVAYSTMSGIIDAIAAVTLDPTIIGGKFGVVSKSARGIGRVLEKAGVEGAESAMLIGREARNVRSQYALTKKNLEDARQVANAARQGAGEDLITSMDLARMGVEEARDLVREARIADRVTEYSPKFIPDTKLAMDQAKQMRRAAGRKALIDDTILGGSLPSGQADDIAADIAMIRGERDTRYRVINGKVTELVDKETLKSNWYDFYKTVIENPEMRDRYNRLMDEYNTLWEQGNYGATAEDEYRALTDFLDILQQRGTITVQRAEDVPLDRVLNDTIRTYLNPTAQGVEDSIKGLDYDGVTLVDELVPDQAGIASVNGESAMSYWRGANAPVYALGSEIIPEAQRQAILDPLIQFLDQPGMSGVTSQVAVEADSMTERSLKALQQATDPRESLTLILGSETLTYARLLDQTAKLGLDSILDDVLRSQGIDGIKALDPRDSRVAWMGNHPDVVAYYIADEARAAGAAALKTADPEDFISRVDMEMIPTEALDLRGMSVADLQRMSIDSGKQAESYRIALDKLAATTVFKADAAETALRGEIDLVVRETDDVDTVLRRNLQYLSGMRNTRYGSLMLDETGVREFLFGRGPASFLANKAIDALANVVSPADIELLRTIPKFKDELGNMSDEWARVYTEALGKLSMLTGHRWFSDTYKEMVDNLVAGGGRESVLQILAARVGVDVSQGSISRTTALFAGDGARQFQTWRKFSEGARRAVSQMPTMRTINLQNAHEVIENVMMYGRYGKVDEEKLIRYVGQVLLEDGTLRAIGANRNAMARVFDDISDNLMAELDGKAANKIFAGTKGDIRRQEIKSALRSSTRLWLGGETDMQKSNVDVLASMSDVRVVQDSNGNPFMLPDIAIETELATGALTLPSVDEWSKALSRLHMTLSRSKAAENVYTIAKDFYDNFFRAGMLVFRVAYIIRNMAEMQIRMFLNGHQSIISDPATMVGMTLGQYVQGKRAPRIAARQEDILKQLTEDLGRKPTKKELAEATKGKRDLFAEYFQGRYANTILDTDFEVGADMERAVANSVEEYFELTRMAHSLTDPRVYNSAVRQGWQTVEYGTPKFNYGWAHELIMLQRSDIVRIMLDPPPSLGYQAGRMDMDQVIKYLQSGDPRAIAIRSKMIGADRRFQDIFNDDTLMKEWLFTSPNSIQNRIVKFTNNDPRLIEYLRTGELMWERGKTMRISSISSNQERVTSFGGLLQRYFNDDTWKAHFNPGGGQPPVGVPWIEPGAEKRGTGFFDLFFTVANKIERMGAVGPEFRMAYWDKIAELAPALRASDIDRALKAARTTLSTIKKMDKSGNLSRVGTKHPVFAALERAKRENSDGMMNIDDIHGMAMQYAAQDVKDLFYDAARRNKFWYSLRLIWPFGQAWGNTLETWSRLGAKMPIQVYKIQKGIDALTESGSSAVYELGSSLPGPLQAYPDYPAGNAPWDQSNNGGFFYTDSYGETSFMYPYAGRLQGAALNVLSALNNGPSIPDTSIQSPAQSLNVALGADSIFPGVSAIAGTALGAPFLPDHDIVESLRDIAMPFGEKNILEAAVPAWLAKGIAGVEAIPGIGGIASTFLDILAPAHVNKHVIDAQFILATSGSYDNWATDPMVLAQLEQDSKSLAKALLLTTGLIQNVLPSTPILSPNVNLAGEAYQGAKEVDPNREIDNERLYNIAGLNVLFQDYVARNNRDYTAAHEEFVRDFGPSALYAAIGDWQSFGKRPTSDALAFARKNPEIAQAYPDYFSLFFPGGDSSDAAAIGWLRRFGSGVVRRKTASEATTEMLSIMQRIQRERINSMEVAGVLDEDAAEAKRQELEERYQETDVTTGTFKKKTVEMEQLNSMVQRHQVIRNSEAGQAFALAWKLREQALTEARAALGDENATLSGQQVAPIKEWLTERVFELEQRYPDFILLGAKFRREWD